MKKHIKIMIFSLQGRHFHLQTVKHRQANVERDYDLL